MCLTSCLASQTSSAPGCCCCSVHRPAPTTPCEHYRLLNRHRTRGPTTKLVGRHSKSVWGAYHRPRRNRPGRSHRCQLFMADPACCQRSGRPRRRTGQHGWMRSPSAGLACPAQLIVAWQLWSKAQRARSPVCAKQRRRKIFYKEGWEACPGWYAAYEGARPPQPRDAGPGEWPHGWQFHATRTRNLHYRDRVLLAALQPSSRALPCSQGGAHACAWLSAVPSEPALTLAPQAMQLALRRRLRLPLPLSPNRCGPSPGCGQQVDEYGDHALACPRTGLLARRAKKRSDQMGNNGSCAQPHLECQLTTADGST